MKNKHLILFAYLMFTSLGLWAKKHLPIDPKATRETKALYTNMGKLSKAHVLFGHQDATAYGHGWLGDHDRSDVKSVCGSHPAVIGMDINAISSARSKEEIEKAKESLRNNVVDTYNRGGITTICWHFSNPVSDGGFNWKDSVSLPAVKYIIPGGEAHDKYKKILDNIADWALSLKGADGALVPLIFRPFHEFDGDWFWWGRSHCTREEFIALWQFTVSYLRDTKHVHNFLYAFSPDNRFHTEAQYLDRYPGDKWVDMLGTDNYGDMGRDRYDIDTAAKKLKIISDYALKTGKLASFTETGLESIPDTSWWTETLIKTLKKYPINISYVLVWRNDSRSPTHFYAPFPGQVSVPNFLRFYNNPYTLFEKDLNNIYEKKKASVK